MDNKINTYNTKTHRTTEQSDTRQRLRRHDPDFVSDEDENQEEREPTDIYEDLTDVSIDALINLLNELSEENNSPEDIDISETATKQAQEAETPSSDGEEAAQQQSSNTQARKAASAYAHALETRPEYNPHVSQALEPENLGLSRDVSLKASIVNTVVRDLRDLKEKGHKTLHLERAEGGGVIASIEQAILKIN